MTYAQLHLMTLPFSRHLRCALLLISLFLQSACHDSNSSAVSNTAAPVSATDICLASECSEHLPLIDIPDAENLVFSADGRLFVSGGQQVYEIKRDADGFSSQAIADENCNFTGLAINANTLYAACGDGRLFAGKLTESPELTVIYSLVDFCLPNGLAAGSGGRLYLTDATLNANSQACLPPNPRIDRLQIDPGDPLNILSQELWLQGSATGGLALGTDNQLRFPNGLRNADGLLFGTDGGSVYHVPILPGGSAGEVNPLYFTPSALDDIALLGDGILVTDFFQGRLILLSRSGEELQSTDSGRFSSPSAVAFGRPPMFRPSDILITEKGIIGDNNLPIDRLSLLRTLAP